MSYDNHMKTWSTIQDRQVLVYMQHGSTINSKCEKCFEVVSEQLPRAHSQNKLHWLFVSNCMIMTASCITTPNVGESKLQSISGYRTDIQRVMSQHESHWASCINGICNIFATQYCDMNAVSHQPMSPLQLLHILFPWAVDMCWSPWWQFAVWTDPTYGISPIIHP